jgi:GntR family transcriptional regulator
MLTRKTASKLQQAYDRSRTPLYVQVASVIRQRIEGRDWLPGQKIPTLEQLEKEFQVARVTVRQAIEIMREEERLECYQGRGTFVSSKTQEKYWLELATDWESLVNSLKDNVAKMLAPVADTPAPSIADVEGRQADGYVLLRSVQYHAKAPYGVISAYLARGIYRKNPAEFNRHPVLPVLAKIPGFKVKRAVQSVTLGSADPEAADLLNVPIGAPTAECRCVVTDERGVVVYVAKIVYRSDCIRLDINLLGGRNKRQSLSPIVRDAKTVVPSTITKLGRRANGTAPRVRRK